MKICIEFPNKKRFPTKKDAETAIFLIGNYYLNLYIYFCDTCQGWHLSSKNESSYLKNNRG